MLVLARARVGAGVRVRVRADVHTTSCVRVRVCVRACARARVRARTVLGAELEVPVAFERVEEVECAPFLDETRLDAPLPQLRGNM
eukprot:4971159-Pleurochrysis_carterae.AAC.1